MNNIKIETSKLKLCVLKFKNKKKSRILEKEIFLIQKKKIIK